MNAETRSRIRPDRVEAMGVRTVSAVLLLALSVSACSDDPGEPSALPTLDPSPTASASVEPEPAPTGIDAPTPEGAAEFARFFYSQVELAYSQKDPTLVERLSAPGCTTCQAFIDTLVDIRDSGDRYEGVQYEITFAEAPALEGDEARVTIIYNGPEVVRYDPTGRVLATEPAVQGFEEELGLVRSGDSWLVAELTRP